ncbi:metal ABC transporter ATP-binding protein [Williamsia herbipolensis]|uniref:metal ABC transporter ATP-binding protein n=1 Tax=Williamsia herbipolensis TaxID=1603258 RepID=UPI0005F787F9|nr:metal ABC transporter ATP-binding protein [Williamsia herbipolensis]
MRGVGVRFGDRWALEAVTAEFDAGCHSVVVGPNGAGKTTALDVVVGVRRPDAGSVEAGTPAYVPQHRVVSDRLPITVGDAVAMGRWRARRHRRLRPEDRSLVREAMDRVAIGDLRDRQVGALSGGQRQRVLIAQALAQQAEVLLLDEPTSGLDAISREVVAQVIAEEAHRGAVVIEVTHDLGAAAHAAHCVVLASGRVVAQGPGAEVLTAARVAAVWGAFTPPGGATMVG